MIYAPRWDKGARSDRKLNSQLQAEKDQVATKHVVIFPKSGECTESMGQVTEVSMIQGYGFGPAVKARGRKNAVGEVVFKVCVFSEKRLQHSSKISVQFRSKRRKGT